MSDTPETDLLYLNQIPSLVQMTTHFNQFVKKCKQLERERDEAREQAQQMSESNQVLMADVRFYRNAWEQLKGATK